MYTSTLISNDKKRAIMLRSFHNRAIKRLKTATASQRSEAAYMSKSYRDGLQRAFNKAKQQVYFNPDMQLFVTLTYKGANHTPEQVLHDVKQFVKYESRQSSNPAGSGRERKLKYIYVMEYQKRGSIHVHMITNNALTLVRNKNGYQSLKYWSHGFSSVLTIKDFDNNFRPHLYLFKYMKKAQRIGKSFVHSSRNLTNYSTATDPIQLFDYNTINMEYTETTIETTNFHYFRNYLELHDTMALQQTNQGLNPLWQKQEK